MAAQLIADRRNLHSGFSAELRTLTTLLLVVQVPKLTYICHMVSQPLLYCNSHTLTWEKSLIIPSEFQSPYHSSSSADFPGGITGSLDFFFSSWYHHIYQNRSHSVNEPLAVVKLDQCRASLVKICLSQIFGAPQHRVKLDSPSSLVLALM